MSISTRSDFSSNMLITDNTNDSSGNLILSIPKEILAHIFSYLEFKSFNPILRTCRQFRLIALSYREAFAIGREGPNKLQQMLNLSNTVIMVSITVMKWLIEIQGVDPSVYENLAIRLASERGHVEAVKFLLADPRVDPSVCENLAIRLASENGYVEIVKLLLADPRVDPSIYDNYAVRAASKRGHSEVVKVLLDDPKIEPVWEYGFDSIE